MDNPQAQEDFRNANGMTLQEAWTHVREWKLAGKNAEAIQGCKEIVKYFPDHTEAKALLAELESSRPAEKKPMIQEVGETMTEKVVDAMQNIQEKHSEEEQAAKKQKAMEFEEEIESAKGKITTNDERFYAMLAYAWILVFIPLIFRRSSLYVQFHARQGVVLFIILYLFQSIIMRLLQIVFPLIDLVSGFFVFALLGFLAYKAWSGKWLKIPLIWNISQKIPH
jgi:uncharacterized membrane protein